MFTLHPYLGFNGQARQALEFYRSCLGGTLDLMPVASSPVAAQIPAHMQDFILHGSLTNDLLTLSDHPTAHREAETAKAHRG